MLQSQANATIDESAPRSQSTFCTRRIAEGIRWARPRSARCGYWTSCGQTTCPASWPKGSEHGDDRGRSPAGRRVGALVPGVRTRKAETPRQADRLRGVRARRERDGLRVPQGGARGARGERPHKFQMPFASELRFNWVHADLAVLDPIEARELVVDAWRLVVSKKFRRQIRHPRGQGCRSGAV